MKARSVALVFALSLVRVSTAVECLGHTTCSSCISDPSKTCKWCADSQTTVCYATDVPPFNCTGEVYTSESRCPLFHWTTAFIVGLCSIGGMFVFLSLAVFVFFKCRAWLGKRSTAKKLTRRGSRARFVTHLPSPKSEKAQKYHLLEPGSEAEVAAYGAVITPPPQSSHLLHLSPESATIQSTGDPMIPTPQPFYLPQRDSSHAVPDEPRL